LISKKSRFEVAILSTSLLAV